MRSRPVKRSSLFLLELIIAILFFSLASAVCVRFFVKSHTLSRETGNLTAAVNMASGQAELFLAEEKYMLYMKSNSYDFEVMGDTSVFHKYYDEKWNSCEPQKAVFEFRTVIEKDGVFHRGTFRVTELSDGAADTPDGGNASVTADASGESATDQEIYSLTVDKYVGGEAVR